MKRLMIVMPELYESQCGLKFESVISTPVKLNTNVQIFRIKSHFPLGLRLKYSLLITLYFLLIAENIVGFLSSNPNAIKNDTDKVRL